MKKGKRSGTACALAAALALGLPLGMAGAAERETMQDAIAEVQALVDDCRARFTDGTLLEAPSCDKFFRLHLAANDALEKVTRLCAEGLEKGEEEVPPACRGVPMTLRMYVNGMEVLESFGQAGQGKREWQALFRNQPPGTEKEYWTRVRRTEAHFRRLQELWPEREEKGGEHPDR